MSIIEKAASKLGTGVPDPAAAARADSPDKSLIEESVDKATASLQSAANPKRSRQTPVDDEGPATVWGGPATSRQVSVDVHRLRAMGMLTPEAGRSKIAEELRLIKRPLLARALGQGDTQPVESGNLIMVTSSLPGEGKSFTAINLAISMSTEMENTVLLVDADVAKSAVLQYLGMRAEKGLIDVLRHPDLPLSDVLIKTDIASLSVLPAGETYGHANELLASSAMQSFVREIATRYPDRIIVFDSPPLLSTSEASVLAKYMGQIVFVVEADRTPQEAISDALTHIQDCEHIGLVLNKAPSRSAGGDYYGYGYGYGYGSGYGEYGS